MTLIWMKGLMTFEEMVEERFNEGKSVGLEEGREETRIETAKNFLKNGISPELIAKCTGLPLEKVLELRKPPVALAGTH